MSLSLVTSLGTSKPSKALCDVPWAKVGSINKRVLLLLPVFRTISTNNWFKTFIWFEPISVYDDVNDSYIEILVFLNEQGKELLEKIKEKNKVSEEAITMEDIEQATYENFNEYNENY